MKECKTPPNAVKKEFNEISRREFLSKSGKVIALGTLSHFISLGSAQAGIVPFRRDPCPEGNLEYIPALDKCGVHGTPDEPAGDCGTAYWACLIIGHRPE